MPRSKDLVLQELARENTRLTGLERTRDEARTKIESLRSELAATSIATPISLPPPFASEGKTPSTPTDKVKLFRSLFRGREDILPIRFVSKKTGKPGYAPACSNKWEPGLCLLKTGGTCSDCMNQAFDPVGDQVVLDHLQGRHVIGACPLLEDESCWFLAVDFDKNSWTEDVAAFAETCRSVGKPVAIERSRSGNGAHAWFFFAAPVSANVARRMGCYLVTETMNRRHELSMESYDRLFPNQDTMPRGGFGNLIALPLQHEPRQQGNSVFIDERFEPFMDQWTFLYLTPSPFGRVEQEPKKLNPSVGSSAESVGVEHYINSSRDAVRTSSSLEGWCVRMPPHPSLPTVDLHMPHAGIDTELVGIGNLRRGSARLISH